MAEKLVRVRTGRTSYLKMTEKEAAEYRKNVGEYGETPAEPQAAKTMATDDRARKAPAEKKQG